jgi:hypothetical protein
MDKDAWLKLQAKAFQRFSEQRERVEQKQVLPVPQQVSPNIDQASEVANEKVAVSLDATLRSTPTYEAISEVRPAPNDTNKHDQPTADPVTEPPITSADDNNISSLRRSQRVRRPPQRYGFDDNPRYGYFSPALYMWMVCANILQLSSQWQQKHDYDELVTVDCCLSVNL